MTATWDETKHDRATTGVFTGHTPTPQEIDDLGPDTLKSGLRFAGFDARYLTPAARARVEKDLNRAVDGTDGRAAVTLRDVIAEDGLASKHSVANKGKLEYYLVGHQLNGDGNPNIHPVSEPTWKAIEAKDLRGSSACVSDEVIALKYKESVLLNKEDTPERESKLRALRQRIGSAAGRRNMMIGYNFGRP